MLRRLKELLEKEEAIKNQIAMVTEGLNAEKKEVSREIDEIKGVLTLQGLETYQATGNKKLDGGLGIRVSSVLEYDQAKALEFAKEKNMFLQLDSKAFEKVAGSLGLDFVTTKDKITVTYPKEIVINE